MPCRAQIVQVAQNLRQLVRAELARSTGPVRELSESLFHFTSLRGPSVRLRASANGRSLCRIPSGSSPDGSSRCGPGPLPRPPNPHLSPPLCSLALRLPAHRGAARVPYPGRRVRTYRRGLLPRRCSALRHRAPTCCRRGGISESGCLETTVSMLSGPRVPPSGA